MQFLPGMSLAVAITNSSQAIPGPKVIFLILPRGTRLRTVAPNNMSGSDISSIYCARPVTLSRPSLRGTELPTMCSDITSSHRRVQSDMLPLQQLASLRLSWECSVLKNQFSSKVSSLHYARQRLSQIRGDRVTRMQPVRRYRELCLGIEYDKVRIRSCSNSSLATLASC